jgi:hypothetical protein
LELEKEWELRLEQEYQSVLVIKLKLVEGLEFGLEMAIKSFKANSV